MHDIYVYIHEYHILNFEKLWVVPNVYIILLAHSLKEFENNNSTFLLRFVYLKMGFF